MIGKFVRQKLASRAAARATAAEAGAPLSCSACQGTCHCPLTGEDVDLRLADIALREDVELVRIDLPDEELEPLLERGILPGCRLCPVRRSPSGDPILLVDGLLVAVRKETAGCLCVKRADSSAA